MIINTNTVLTFDSTPTEDSTHPVTSGGVYTALSNISPSYIIEATVSLSQGTGNVENVTVTATASGYDTLTGLTDSQGKVQLNGAKAGVTYTVTASKTGYASMQGTVKIEHLTNPIALSIYQYGTIIVSQTPVSGEISVSGGIYTIEGDNVYVEPGIEYTVSVAQVPGYVQPVSQTATLTAGDSTTLTFTHVAYPTVTVTQSGATGIVSVTPQPFSVSGNVYTLEPLTSYTIGVSQVSGYLKPADQTVLYSAGTTNNVTFTHVTLPVIRVTVTDPQNHSAIGVSATNGTETVTGTVNASSGSGYVDLTVNYADSYTVSIPTPPTGGSAGTDTVTTIGGQTVNAGITVSYGFGFTILRIQKSTTSPTSRCTYPSSVTINGNTYTNSAPSESNCAKGTSLNGWANHKLIEGIKPVLKNGSTWTDLDKSSSASWSTSGDAFTEFPFRWLGFYKDSTYDYILLSDESENPDSTVFNDYAFLNNSNVRQPNTHVGCFDADYTSNVLGSKRGSTEKVSTSLTNFISYASARGTDYDIITYWQAQYITALFCTLYKTTDCQGYSDSTTGLGRGWTDQSAKRGNSGLAFGNNYGLYGDRSAGKSTVVFFWIHDIWGNIYQWVGGAKTNSSRQLMTCVGKMSSTTESNFNLTESTSGAYPTSSVSGYMTDMAGTVKSGFFPIASSSGSSTTYFSDSASVNSSDFPRWGGRWSSTDGAGLFYWNFGDDASITGGYLGSRLSFKGGRS